MLKLISIVPWKVDREHGRIVPAIWIALGTAVSLIGALSNVLSMASFTSQLSILIGLGVGIDYSLFILTRTRTEMRRGRSIADAIGISAAFTPTRSTTTSCGRRVTSAGRPGASAGTAPGGAVA